LEGIAKGKLVEKFEVNLTLIQHFLGHIRFIQHSFKLLYKNFKLCNFELLNKRIQHSLELLKKRIQHSLELLKKQIQH
jgi:hypothetical protein